MYNSNKGLELEYAYSPKTDFSEKSDNTIDFSLPDKTTATIGSETINYLEFIYNNLLIKHSDTPRAVMEYVFSNYPNLSRFILKDSSNASYKVRADNLKETEGLKTRTCTQENLKVIELVNIAKHQRRLKMIDNYFPFNGSMHRQFIYRNSSYDDMNFNLNPFDNLVHFYFCVKMGHRINSRFLNIGIYSENSPKKTYYYDAEIKKKDNQVL
ncbi:hypothetical protein INT48_001844 [Thamnidium elegans]|uniref:Uncharacterized protein n=1 Tax=Thamnidium elegans TaxID=101142 RepID=A0A8H7SZ94_9FUNG|nr:hypothetical protein INT48_001844 [Thamnidium elegans]